MNSLKTNPIYIINDSYTTIQITTLQYILVLEFSIDRVTTIPRDWRQKRVKILTKSTKAHMPDFILSISFVYYLWLVFSFVLNYVVVILDSMTCTIFVLNFVYLILDLYISTVGLCGVLESYRVVWFWCLVLNCKPMYHKF